MNCDQEIKIQLFNYLAGNRPFSRLMGHDLHLTVLENGKL